jgi:hypothetical protein
MESEFGNSEIESMGFPTTVQELENDLMMTNMSRKNAEGASSQGRLGSIWKDSVNCPEWAQFDWVDEETGELLVLKVAGDQAFFDGLENLGFTRRTQDQRPSSVPTGGADSSYTIETPRRGNEAGVQAPAWQDRRGA